MGAEFINSEGEPYVLEDFISSSEINTNIKRIGSEIARDYQGEIPILAIILKGGLRFGGRVMDELDLNEQPYQYDVLALTSYGDDTESSTEPRIQLDLSLEINGRHVIVVEDIIDSGLSIAALLKLLATRNPKSIKICSMFSKPERRKVDVPIDYLGMEIPDKFAVQFGLDYAQQHRNGSSLKSVRFV